jgi:starch-binding outer membrane protein, SusD/RagB family
MQSSGLSLLDYTEIAGDMAGKLSSKETVFGIYSKSFADPVIKILHNSQTAYSLEMRYNIQQLYQVDGTGNDYRWSAWYTYNDVAKDWKLDKLTDSYVLNNNEYSRPKLPTPDFPAIH